VVTLVIQELVATQESLVTLESVVTLVIQELVATQESLATLELVVTQESLVTLV